MAAIAPEKPRFKKSASAKELAKEIFDTGLNDALDVRVSNLKIAAECDIVRDRAEAVGACLEKLLEGYRVEPKLTPKT